MMCAAAGLDRRFFAWSAAWALASLVVFGLVAAIIPNPVFGRQIPPEPFAIALWVLSAPLMGLVAATYTTAVPPTTAALELGSGSFELATQPQGTTLGTAAGIGVFLAIGCPVCNKIALVLLGASGALTVFAPLQPVIGVASLALLAGTLVWRIRLRARGGACAVRT
jgi:hypothetical protein